MKESFPTHMNRLLMQAEAICVLISSADDAEAIQSSAWAASELLAEARDLFDTEMQKRKEY